MKLANDESGLVKKTKPELIAKINFYSSNAVEKYKHKQQSTTVFPGTFVEPKDKNIGTFLEKLSKLSSKAIVLHAYSEHCTSFVPNYKPPERAKSPNSLRDLYSKNNLNLKGTLMQI